MAERIGAASGLPVIRVGRMAGQFAKPRSAPIEVQGGVALPAYRGDIVNGIAFDAAARRPDPERMFRAYAQAAATLARLRALGRDVYTSHEALLLPFEEPLVRRDPASGRCYASSAHFLWIGDRTRFPGSAHVEFAPRPRQSDRDQMRADARCPRCCCRLLAILDPEREPGRITLIARMGHDRVGERPAAAAPRRRRAKAIRCSGPAIRCTATRSAPPPAPRPAARPHPRRNPGLLRQSPRRRACAAAACISR